VSAPDEPPFERFDDMIEWVDNRTVPWQSSQVAPELPHYLLTARSTGDRAVVEWQPNRVWITPRRIGAMQYALDLQHTMLHPSHYEMRVLESLADGNRQHRDLARGCGRPRGAGARRQRDWHSGPGFVGSTDHSVIVACV